MKGYLCHFCGHRFPVQEAAVIEITYSTGELGTEHRCSGVVKKTRIECMSDQLEECQVCDECQRNPPAEGHDECKSCLTIEPDAIEDISAQEDISLQDFARGILDHAVKDRRVADRRAA